jgi:glycosyltransferase involved in cell wall biosynthesis
VKILIYSPHFHPRVGGLENVVRGLAEAFHEEGHQVTVACTTAAGSEPDPFPYPVVRTARGAELLRLTRAADVVLHACVNIRGLWPLLITATPLAITHQVYLTHPVPRPTLWSKVVREVKRFSTRRAFVNIACSECLARHVGPRCVAVPNFYDDHTFRVMEGIRRDSDLVFLGRLVSDKGADLAMEALRLLREERGLTPRLTLIGEGPEREALMRQARDAGLAEAVRFAGVLKGEELACELNRHRLMLVPSRWPEPFGIVALEGIACGLAVVGTRNGGLAEAIGPCGVAVENGNAGALAAGIAELLTDKPRLEACRDNAPAHLARHTRQVIAREYLRLISRP